MDRQTLIIFLLLGIIFILWVIKTELQTRLAGEDIEYVAIETQLSGLQVRNSLLLEQLLHDAALTTIYEKAREQGMVDR